jgi:predicted dehydrogenase
MALASASCKVVRGMREIRFGIIGVGVPNQVSVGPIGADLYSGIAEWHARYINETPGCRVVAAASRTEAHVRLFAQKFNLGDNWYTDYRKLLERDDIDAVSICTPSGLHAQIGIEAARAGKHVLVEKPIDVTLEKADALIEECERANVKLGVVMPLRFSKAVKFIKRMLDDGVLGKPLLANAFCRRYRTEAYYAESDWRGTWALDGGGACMNQGIHIIDTYIYLLGGVRRIHARMGTLGHKALEVEDVAVADVELENGALGMIECTTCAYPDFGDSIHIYGERGTVITDGTPPRITFFEVIDSEFKPNLAELEERKEPFTLHRNVIADFVEAIRENREPIVNGREGRKAVELILALYKSAREGREVELPLK